ncbi:OsmC family protein [Brachybacterium sp. GCM10030267]|uniref:OsmC family protein n=1 Tax=Brachybacterium sp. GCM10030267 TaxID=3273381 RepID=UPI0036182300
MTADDRGASSGPTSSPHPEDPALYTARTDNIHGTTGEVRVHDGPTAHRATLPTGGPSTPHQGFTPEQFLAMAWSTCLGETLRVVLAERELPHQSSVSVEVELHRDPAGGYRFAPRALVSIPDMAADEARTIADAAHARCPVSKLLTGQGTPRVELVTADG